MSNHLKVGAKAFPRGLSWSSSNSNLERCEFKLDDYNLVDRGLVNLAMNRVAFNRIANFSIKFKGL